MKSGSAPEGTHSVRRRLGVSDSLVTAILGAGYATPRVVRKERKRGSPQKVGDDALILEVRRLREQLGMTGKAIRTHLLGLGISMTNDRVCSICEYQTRSSLVPAPGAAPYITKQGPA